MLVAKSIQSILVAKSIQKPNGSRRRKDILKYLCDNEENIAVKYHLNHFCKHDR